MIEKTKKSKSQNSNKNSTKKKDKNVDTQIIKKEDIVPPQLALIPLDGKPVVPGMLLPVFIRGDKNTKALMEHLEKMENSFVGFVYSKREIEQSAEEESTKKKGSQKYS